MNLVSRAPHPNPPPAAQAEGGVNEREWPHAVVDLLACAVLALMGSGLVWALNPFTWLPDWLGAFRALHASEPMAVAVVFALLGPLGAGIDRGRAPVLVRVLAPLGAASGALAGAIFLEHVREPLELLLRAGPPLVLGPLLVGWGTRLHRPEEGWRPEARLGPPDATPGLALRIARAGLPLPLRIVLFPLTLALLPVGLVGVVFIRCYQLALSRLLPPQCRFEPSCSRYGLQAFARFGAVKGFLLTALRVGRCHPFCKAGHDPLPEDRG